MPSRYVYKSESDSGVYLYKSESDLSPADV